MRLCSEGLQRCCEANRIEKTPSADLLDPCNLSTFGQSFIQPSSEGIHWQDLDCLWPDGKLKMLQEDKIRVWQGGLWEPLWAPLPCSVRSGVQQTAPFQPEACRVSGLGVAVGRAEISGLIL